MTLTLALTTLSLAGPAAAPAHAVPENTAVAQLNMKGQSDWTNG
ncbi:hypothetical protein [Streptomyces sp. NPDC093094]